MARRSFRGDVAVRLVVGERKSSIGGAKERVVREGKSEGEKGVGVVYVRKEEATVL